MKKIECEYCKEEAKFFHSRCCNSHFEGVIAEGCRIIVCEKCGKYVAHVAANPHKENSLKIK